MSKSFDEKLEELHKSRQLEMRTDIWPEGTREFNQKLCIAEDLLQVSWHMPESNSRDPNLESANTKVPTITNLRKSIEESFTHINNFKKDDRNLFLKQHSKCSRSVMEKFLDAELSFQFEEMRGAYQLLADCLCPFQIDSLGEMFHTNTTYRKLLQLSALYGFKMNSNISINHLTNGSFSLETEVATILDGTIKPDNISGFFLQNNEDVSFSRLKFGQEDKVDVAKAHPDFLKIVALIRMFHSTLLQNIKPSYAHAGSLDQVVTYGLLTEKKYVRVLGIKAFVPDNSCSTYQYLLFNVGVFPIAPSNEEEKQQLDLLISFLLEASRHTIFEENKVISNITKESFGKRRMKSSVMGCTFSPNDKLVIRRVDEGTKQESLHPTTTIVLCKYKFEMSTPESKSTPAKDLFLGSIEHSNQPVFVKIFRKAKPFISMGNIFLASNEVMLNNNQCSEYVEISLAGEVLNTFISRQPEETMYIITQLLLEIDHIHSQKIIHNDVKPSNIIRWTQKQEVPVDTKEELPTTPKYYFKFIDFELAQQFLTEDGNICRCNNIALKSTAGTCFYNAPEKEGRENYIHPKTDIYSLGLIFVELITNKVSNKKILSNFEPDIWKIIETKCNEFKKGQEIYKMLRSMLSNTRKERMTARECLQLLDITELVDTQDYTHHFFPTNTTTSNSETTEATLITKDEEKANISNNLLSKQKKLIKKTHKICCKCKNGTCQNCACGSKGNTCTSCRSINCNNKEENKRKRTSKYDETVSEDDSQDDSENDKNSKKIKSK